MTWTDPLDTKRRRLADLENLACRLNDLKAIGVRWPTQECHALVAVICDIRDDIQRAEDYRKEHANQK